LRLAGNTIVQTLDIDTGEPWRGPITSLFEKYPTCLELPFINPYHNVLKLNNVKITDWTGWTNLLYIEQNIMYGEVWKEVKIGRESVIALFHPKSLIPTWRNMNYRRSFNGREVYEYKVVPITELDEARGRVLYGSDPSSPKSVLNLRMSPKKFAKKNNIRLKGKGISKKERKHNHKRLIKEYSDFAATGLNKAVKILAENPDAKKADKVKEGVENIITNPDVMKRIVKIYKKNPGTYPNMMFLPNMIMNTLVYYASDAISDEEKEVGKALDTDSLITFCEKILKKEIKRYEKFGLEEEVAYQLATVIPTTKLFRNRQWYKRLIQQMYDIAEKNPVDIDAVLKAVCKIDKKKGISKKEFLEGFFSEFILTKASNSKTAKFTDTQKELHEGLIERTLVYLDNLKVRKTKEILKRYIKKRQTAESYKNDTKRVIKFIDHANSNSPYSNIKSAINDLIADNSAYEAYLS